METPGAEAQRSSAEGGTSRVERRRREDRGTEGGGVLGGDVPSPLGDLELDKAMLTGFQLA